MLLLNSAGCEVGSRFSMRQSTLVKLAMWVSIFFIIAPIIVQLPQMKV